MDQHKEREMDMRVLQSYVAELLGVKLTRLKELNTDEIQIDSEAIVNGAICKLFESWQVKFTHI